MKINVNTDIALTYLMSRKKQTIVASLGVTFGISMFIFLQSMMKGTNDYFEKMSFNAMPHIRIYKDYTTSGKDIMEHYYKDTAYKILINPKLVPNGINITNPFGLINQLKKDTAITAITAQVTANIFYNNGNIQVSGQIVGSNILEEDKMFDLRSNMIAGSLDDLPVTSNGMLVGKGIADKLSLHVGDNMTITTPAGTLKLMKVVGIFSTTILQTDNTRAYANLSTVQQVLGQGPSYVTDIYVNIHNYHNAPAKARMLERLTGYTADDWLKANAQMQTSFRIREIILNSVILVILIVAGFGIYNILNMTIYEKIKEIAILKATGFSGRAVTSIFLQQAIYIGFMGGLLGLGVGYLTSLAVSKIYLGPGILKYLPMAFLPLHYIQGLVFGMLTTSVAGYLPARKASKVDPVKIIRG